MGVSFPLHHDLMKLLRSKLNDLELNIAPLTNKFKSSGRVSANKPTRSHPGMRAWPSYKS